MPLFIAGFGTSIEYVTLRLLDVLREADKVYIDAYTSIAPGLDADSVARLAPRAEIVIADRKLLEEKQSVIIEEAREKNIVVLVPGDPMLATTHVTLRIEAVRRGVSVELIHGVSGLQAVVSYTGLQVYRFGRTVTLVYPEEGFKPYSTVEYTWENLDRGLHTLILLDLRLDQGRAMSINEAIPILLELEDELVSQTGRKERLIRDSILVGVARAGTREAKCRAGKAEEVASEAYPPPPHSLIVTAPRLHPIEEEALHLICNLGVARHGPKTR
ncbi:diphthine synthase [Pyrolobus fumarii 1A]|uniref:Diphthine synthase n=1 Tax=Pyrolobus fumarii (strain DSM 11204 / 1A) TaxID=694429 RepID=G0EF60_PYRF1|nr:diphthine synthase [Pyrolobus fumarii]AEM38957.1 diphthine synthase [Pyrolobus fumarii 1A]